MTISLLRILRAFCLLVAAWQVWGIATSAALSGEAMLHSAPRTAFDVQGARAAGYSDAEIRAYLAGAGYTQERIGELVPYANPFDQFDKKPWEMDWGKGATVEPKQAMPATPATPASIDHGKVMAFLLVKVLAFLVFGAAAHGLRVQINRGHAKANPGTPLLLPGYLTI